jgi:hypothetical protein
MLRTLSQDEVAFSAKRIQDLYLSPWIVDNLTAILMDAQKGGTGFSEEISRVKVHGILNWLRNVAQVEVPGFRTKGDLPLIPNQ